MTTSTPAGLAARTEPTPRRLSWPGTLAGWVVGLVVTLSVVAPGRA